MEVIMARFKNYYDMLFYHLIEKYEI